MAKTITKRDLVVIKVVTAFMPYVAEITITRYIYLLDDPTEASEWVACIKIRGGKLEVKLLDEAGQWLPICVDVLSSLDSQYRPGTYSVGENREGYVFDRQ